MKQHTHPSKSANAKGELDTDDELIIVVTERQTVPPSLRRYVLEDDVERWLSTWSKAYEQPMPEATITN